MKCHDCTHTHTNTHTHTQTNTHTNTVCGAYQFSIVSYEPDNFPQGGVYRLEITKEVQLTNATRGQSGSHD